MDPGAFNRLNMALHRRCFYILFLASLSCSEFHDKNKKGDIPIQVKLVLERGAFHYDKFVLEDTTITYYPSTGFIPVDHDKYRHVSTKAITPDERNTLIQYLVDQGIYDLLNFYPSYSTCSSELKVTFKLNGKVKQTTAEDFKRGCPKVLQFLEHQVVSLHGKGLERIMLPG